MQAAGLPFPRWPGLLQAALLVEEPSWVHVRLRRWKKGPIEMLVLSLQAANQSNWLMGRSPALPLWHLIVLQKRSSGGAPPLTRCAPGRSGVRCSQGVPALTRGRSLTPASTMRAHAPELCFLESWKRSGETIPTVLCFICLVLPALSILLLSCSGCTSATAPCAAQALCHGSLCSLAPPGPEQHGSGTS